LHPDQLRLHARRTRLGEYMRAAPSCHPDSTHLRSPSDMKALALPGAMPPPRMLRSPRLSAGRQVYFNWRLDRGDGIIDQLQHADRMGLLNQIDRVRRAAAAALIAEHIYYLILAWFLQTKTRKSYGARTLLVCPVEDGENRLASSFFQQKDTRLPITWRICHQICGCGCATETAMSIRFLFLTRDSRSGKFPRWEDRLQSRTYPLIPQRALLTLLPRPR